MYSGGINLSDREFESYKRIHNYSIPSEIEEGKIKKEKNNHIKYSKKSKKLSKDMLRNIKSSVDFDDLHYEDIEAVNLKATKEKGNAKAHNKRLKKLNKHDEFV